MSNFEQCKTDCPLTKRFSFVNKDGLFSLQEFVSSVIEGCIKRDEQLSELRKILGPQIDLIKVGEKYGTYKILVSYQDIEKLRFALNNTEETKGEQK